MRLFSTIFAFIWLSCAGAVLAQDFQGRHFHVKHSLEESSPPAFLAEGRNDLGLWTFRSPDGQEMVISVAPKRTDIRSYLQATARLWSLKGSLSFVAGPDQLGENRILARIEGEEVEAKWVQWNDTRILVATSKFPVKREAESLAKLRRFTRNIVLSSEALPDLELRRAIKTSLEWHENTELELQSLSAVRKDMTGFRQEWGAYFQSPPPLYYARYVEYLEARYDAAFVLAFGEEMGMPASLLEERLKAIAIARVEALEALGE